MEIISSSETLAEPLSNEYKPILVFPGQNITPVVEKYAESSSKDSEKGVQRLGQGLISTNQKISSQFMGVLHQRPSTKTFWVETKAKRVYIFLFASLIRIAKIYF
jgi:hypothetical protein